ncbi:hypothetical protein EPUS_02421 [Endocarpon pusillum Z07020]|uniref:Cas1p 10 TM acyl transferase domain-containing protein n=1 Tax=Endocarpon pusillum (strain Z07020 / HMAS-L-300199) TaxID=1263415 RepID=U1HPB3_ENDPU|nr:uncharacterized protein EPUS_02421 [Endocarpon pusillum Z07020]ERF70899.1 hypothetical protein EPUS_02421 [Endocarpon pusillum Z07020]
MDRKRATELSLSAAKHSDLHFEQGSVEIEFLWDPFLNSTTLKNILDRDQLAAEPLNSSKPTTMLVGGGLWHLKDLGATFLDEFERGISSVSATLPRNARDLNGIILPPNAREGIRNLVLFAPVAPPIHSQLDPMRAARFTSENIQAMNNYLRDAVIRDGIEVLWSYSLMTWQQPSAYEEDGYHIVENVADKQADIFLNVRCNSEPSLEHYPFDKTCCNVQPPINLEQQVLIFVATLTILYAFYSASKRKMLNQPATTLLAVNGITAAVGIIAMAVVYCFVADRTLIFDKVQKVSSQRTFLQMITIVMLGGVLTVRKPGDTSAETSAKPTRATLGQKFLSRDQTDEWKGWMQFVILIYHYTGMSNVLWVYQIIRLLVASYLFMTGYGHTIYFLKTNNFSLQRIVSVLVRLNLLSCLLAYVMRTDYNFYYFPALSSFWFLVVYLTIRVHHQPNVVPRVLVLKVFVSVIVVQLLLHTPGVLEFVFELLQKTCKVNVDVHELRFRLSLDAYVVYIGMFTAILHLQITGGLPCSTTCLATQIKKIPTAAHVSAICASGVIVPTYLVLIQKFPDKYAYNWWHPMISPMPIAAFAILRNATQPLRDFHSGLFAWLGRFSLETFILQYHIWLAADTKGLLSLGLSSRDAVVGTEWIDKLGLLCDFTLVTAFFLWVSWAVSHATNVVTSFIVNGQQPTKAPNLLDTVRWRWLARSGARQSEVSISATGHARNSSGQRGNARGEQENINISTPPIEVDNSTATTSRLVLRMVSILLLMCIGNWVSVFATTYASDLN